MQDKKTFILKKNAKELIEPAYYAKQTNLEDANERICAAHFLNIGFSQKLNLSPLLDTHVILSQNREIKTALQFFDFLTDLKIQNNDLVSLSADVSWLLRFIHGSPNTYQELLSSTIKTDYFSPAPWIASKSLHSRGKTIRDLLYVYSQVPFEDLFLVTEKYPTYELLLNNLFIPEIRKNFGKPINVWNIKRQFLEILAVNTSSFNSKSFRNEIKFVNHTGNQNNIEDILFQNPVFIKKDYKFKETPTVGLLPFKRPAKDIWSEEEFIKNKNNIIKNRPVIYTACFDNYDRIRLTAQNDDFLHLVFTDQVSSGFENPEGLIVVKTKNKALDGKRTSLWYKTHPHYYFEGCPFTFWIDSNIKFSKDFYGILSTVAKFTEIASFKHPERNCLFEEADIVKQKHLDFTADIEKAKQWANLAGLQPNMGLFETNGVLSIPDDKFVQLFYNKWWERIYLASRRDQLSFTAVSEFIGLPITQLLGNLCTKNSSFFDVYNHSKPRGQFEIN